MEYRGLNEVTSPLSAATWDVLEFQDELASKASKCYATTDIANMFALISLAARCRPQFGFTWRGNNYHLLQGWKHSPTIYHGLTQTVLALGEAPEHLQYIAVFSVWATQQRK